MTTTRRQPVRRLARSYLIAPGSHERLVQDVFDAGADAVVLDLEEGVAAGHKSRARELVARVLNERGRRPGPLVLSRVNRVQSGWWRDDLVAVVSPGLDGVRVAHVESRDDVDAVDAMLNALERERNLGEGSIEIVPTIESAAGVLQAAAIAASPRVRVLTFGTADFLRDLGATGDAGDLETLYARSHLVITSRALGLLPPIAPMHPQLDDADALRRTSEAARRLGFFGRSCVHPSQLATVHDVFGLSPTAVAEARMVVGHAHHLADSGQTWMAADDGRVIDLPTIGRARALLALVDSLGQGHA